MYSLFSSDPSKAGFRLQYMELFNWGTFDKTVIKINPQGNSSLLTGGNGSGKTTLVDGILTLMVPEVRNRFYNQSSGSSTKKERSEETYVLGHYGRIQEENQLNSTIQKLRPDKEKAISILLANFFNEGLSEHITLAQVRWFSSGELKRLYIISHKPLEMDKDFNEIDSVTLWKQLIKKKYPKIGNKEIIQFYDGPGNYSNDLRKFFGMRSEKALTLFNQTVGIKVLGKLDEFIRKNMLEESNIEDEFKKLKMNYNELLIAHKSIEKVKEQSKLLAPIKGLSESLDKAEKEKNYLTEIKNTIKPYFSSKKEKLIEIEIKNKESELEILKLQTSNLITNLDQIKEQEREIDSDIRNNEIGKQIQELEKEIRINNTEKTKRDNQLKRYNVLINKLSYTENPDENIFYETLEQAKLRIEKILEELPELNGILTDLKMEEKEIQKEKEKKESELYTLLRQKNNITGTSQLIRNEILDYVSASEIEIPFIGELIQVKQESLDWQPVIEKVLHNFAMSLIVPEKYYNTVNEYVNKTNLNGRIVYFKVDEKHAPNIFKQYDSASLITKLEIKPESNYYDWLEESILKNYDYICTNIDEFRKFKKAITKEGLIRTGSKNEKDDRQDRTGKSNFILGWDNRDKVKITMESISSLEKLLKDKDKEIKQIEKRIKAFETDKDNLNNLKNFDNYTDLNWREISIKIQELETRKLNLEASNDRINELKKQQTKLVEEIKGLDEKIKSYNKLEFNIDNSILNSKKGLAEIKDILSKYILADLLESFTTFEEYFDQENLNNLNLNNIDSLNTNLLSRISINILNIDKELGDLSEKLRDKIQFFKNPSEDLLEKFPDWRSETYKLSNDIKYVQDYLDIYDKIISEELPEYLSRFKKYLSNDMINKIADFQTLLGEQEENITDNIEALNNSLKKINFRNNPSTYIQIKAIKTRAPNIRDFKNKLKEWKPDIGKYELTKDDSILETSFSHIQELINKLSDNENWRKEVLDVRNWMEFSAIEYSSEDHTQYKIYENTNELSGGEKAQISYTILGSAIAYQFGINQDGMDAKSFRFIIVDEAFSNQDDEKSTYLMDLCKQLHLQLLVVTPDEKARIVEPYISSVHFVQRINNRNSILIDMPINQYFEEKQKALESES